MSCCPEHKQSLAELVGKQSSANEYIGKEKEEEVKKSSNQKPKSLITKWLYKIGKADYEKNGKKHSGCH